MFELIVKKANISLPFFYSISILDKYISTYLKKYFH